MKSLGELLKLYANNPRIVGGFGQRFAKGLVATDKFEQDPKRAFYTYHVSMDHKNIQDTGHGGALVTLIDVATTISMLRLTGKRTISISLNTQFLNVVKLGTDIGVETEITKIGKNIVYADCRIYADIHQGKGKLACRGSHIKSIQNQMWDFLTL